MNKKIGIISAVLFVVGLFIVFGTLVVIGFNFDKIANITKESVEVKEDFNRISVECSTADITIKPSKDGKRSMETLCSRGVVIKHSVENGELKIKEIIDFGRSFFYTGENKVTLYLPKNEYKSLKIDGSSSDVNIDGINFSSAEIIASTADIVINSDIDRLAIDVTTGDILINEMKTEELSVTTSTGDVTVKDANIAGNVAIETSTGDIKIFSTVADKDVKIKASTGDVEMKNTRALTLTATVSAGEIELESVILTGEMKLKSTSGDIELDRCDAQSLSIEASGGDVEGTLLSEKIFYASSGSGDISLPKSTEGGMCEITTSSGDITFKIATSKKSFS